MLNLEESFNNSTILSNYMAQVNKELKAAPRDFAAGGQACSLDLSVSQMFDN